MKTLCIGKILLDVVVEHAKRFPPRYAAQKVNSIAIEPGGGGAFTAQMFSRLGHDVTLLAVRGADRDGDFLDAMLKDAGLSTSDLIRANAFRTLKNVVIVDLDGSAHYIMYSDDAISRIEQGLAILLSERFDLIHVSTLDQIISDDGEPLATWLKAYREKHPQTIISVDASKLTEHAHRALKVAPLVDYFFGNDFELRKIADAISVQFAADELATTPADVVNRIASLGVQRSVVMKLGLHGAVYLDGQVARHCPGFEVKVRNENGAGDVFCTAALHSISDRKTLSEAIEGASALAGMHVAVPFSFDERTPLDITQIVAEMSSYERSPPLMVDQPWWAIPQRVFGYGDRFDETRQLSEREMSLWIETIQKAANLSAASKLLDAGCGTGRFAIPLKDRIGCQIVGVDASEEMLRVARKKSNDIVWQHGDLARLDAVLSNQAGSFDCVWMSAVLTQLAEQLENVLAQLHAQLKPGGALLIRFMSQELIPRVAWYKYFPKARDAAQQRCQNVGRIISYTCQAGFTLREARLFENSDPMPLEEFARRLQSGGQTWISRVSSNELNEGLRQLKDDYLRQDFFYDHPSYLLVFDKDQK